MLVVNNCWTCNANCQILFARIASNSLILSEKCPNIFCSCKANKSVMLIKHVELLFRAPHCNIIFCFLDMEILK